MQNPIGFDLGTISRLSRCAQSRGWGGKRREKMGGKKEASLIEFYVAVVRDLNMPEFITRRIIMPYKKWQSQTGAPHFICCSAAVGRLCHCHPHSQAPFCALFFFFFLFFPPLWKWNICVWHWSQKINMNLETVHSVHLIIFWQIYLPFSFSPPEMRN